MIHWHNNESAATTIKSQLWCTQAAETVLDECQKARDVITKEHQVHQYILLYIFVAIRQLLLQTLPPAIAHHYCHSLSIFHHIAAHRHSRLAQQPFYSSQFHNNEHILFFFSFTIHAETYGEYIAADIFTIFQSMPVYIVLMHGIYKAHGARNLM